MLNERLFAAARAPSGWPRLPTIAGEAMVATSHPLATSAGARAFQDGGNAVDAALAAAAVLPLCEPPHNGIGGDALALLWWDGELHGLNGSGRAPAVIDAPTVDSGGPRSVTVPGAVRAWADLAERFGRLGLDAAAPARVWPGGGTTFLCAVDGDRNAIALIQSVYEGFGSGVVAGDTGIWLHSRGACFTEEEGHPNQLAPGKRPFHTLIPGMLLRDGALLGPFGVMGAAMQAQAHFKVVRHVVDDGLDPQAALDAPRFRATGGRRVLLEPGLAAEVDGLRARGHEAEVADVPHPFGVGQMILADGDALVAGSDGRADGHAAGL